MKEYHVKLERNSADEYICLVCSLKVFVLDVLDAVYQTDGRREALGDNKLCNQGSAVYKLGALR